MCIFERRGTKGKVSKKQKGLMIIFFFKKVFKSIIIDRLEIILL